MMSEAKDHRQWGMMQVQGMLASLLPWKEQEP